MSRSYAWVLLMVMLLWKSSGGTNNDIRRRDDSNVPDDVTPGLLRLYNATNGPSTWINRTGWDAAYRNQPPIPEYCAWYGVDCNGSSTRVVLYLAGNGLSGTLPESLEGLSDVLTWLDLGNDTDSNSIGGTLPKSWSTQLPHAQLVSLSQNQLMGTLPELWSNLSCQFLYLDTNFLEGTLPEVWSHLPNIVNLLLHANAGLHGTLPASWGNWSNMQVISIHNTMVSGSLPASWSGMTSMKYAVLYGNQLSGTLPPEWQSMKQLQQMYLYANQLTGSLPPQWSSFSNLNTFGIGSNMLSGTLPVEYMKMCNLTSLDITGNSLSGTLPAEWAENESSCLPRSLTHFLASMNNFTAPFPTSWSTLPKLMTIGFNYNNLTYFPDVAFPELVCLELAACGLIQEFPSNTYLNSPKLKHLSMSLNPGLSGSLPVIRGTTISFAVSGSMMSGNLGTMPADLSSLVYLNTRSQNPGMVPFRIADNPFAINASLVAQTAAFELRDPAKRNGCISLLRPYVRLNSTIRHSAFDPPMFIAFQTNGNDQYCEPPFAQLLTDSIMISYRASMQPSLNAPWENTLRWLRPIPSSLFVLDLSDLDNALYNVTYTLRMNFTVYYMLRNMTSGFTITSPPIIRNDCPHITMAVPNSTACGECPEASDCDGSPTIVGKVGKWRPNPGVLPFEQCIPASACDPMQPLQCNEGYEGFMCSTCSAGYGQWDGYCVACLPDGLNIALLAAVVLCILAGITVLVKIALPLTSRGLVVSSESLTSRNGPPESEDDGHRNSVKNARRRYVGAVKMLINYGTSIRILSRSSAVDALHRARFLSLGLNIQGQLGGTGVLRLPFISCLFPEQNPNNEFLVMIVAIAALLVIEACHPLWHKLLKPKYERWWTIQVVACTVVFQVTYMSIVEYSLPLVISCHSFAFETIAERYGQVRDGGSEKQLAWNVLPSSYNTQCPSVLHVPAVIVLLGVGVGGPLLMAIARKKAEKPLVKDGGLLISAETGRAFQFLQANFLAKYWYWELVLMCRKFLGFAVVVGMTGTPDAQLTVLNFVWVSFIALQLAVAPFVTPEQNAAELLNLGGCFLVTSMLQLSTTYQNYAMSDSSSRDYGWSVEDTVAGLALASLCFTTIAYIGILFRFARGKTSNQQDDTGAVQEGSPTRDSFTSVRGEETEMAVDGGVVPSTRHKAADSDEENELALQEEAFRQQARALRKRSHLAHLVSHSASLGASPRAVRAL